MFARQKLYLVLQAAVEQLLVEQMEKQLPREQKAGQVLPGELLLNLPGSPRIAAHPMPEIAEHSKIEAQDPSRPECWNLSLPARL